MNKIFFSILFVLITSSAFSQEDETTLKKEIVAVNIGLLGAWINYERHLFDLFTLWAEVGVEGSIGHDFLYGDTYYGFTPSIKLEPRYYYSFNRRVRLGKKTSYNASNYLAVTVMYIPSVLTVSNDPFTTFQRSISIIPKWGVKRTVGQRFNFEFALGPGVYIGENRAEATAGLDVKFGYNIK